MTWMTRRSAGLLSGLAVAAALVVGVACSSQWGQAGALDREGEHEALARINGASCGAEHWPVKTGTDSGARSVNLGHVAQTNIIHLRSLAAPA